MDKILFFINYNKMDSVSIVLAIIALLALSSLFLESKDKEVKAIHVYLILVFSLIVFSGGTYLNQYEKSRMETLICTDLGIDFSRCEVSGYSLYITVIKESTWKFQVEKKGVSPIKDRDVVVINLAPGDLFDKALDEEKDPYQIFKENKEQIKSIISQNDTKKS